MTDIQGLRTQLRDTGHKPAPRDSGSGGIPFWIIAAAAAALGFAIVLFAPRFFTTQRTAALPAFQAAANRADASDGGQAFVPGPEPPAPANGSRYAGKSLEDVVSIADAVCEHRAQAVRVGAPPARPSAADLADAPKITAADEKLHCFLSEAPARFCAPNQKRKVTADVINYFKGIEYANAAFSVAAKIAAIKVDGSRPQKGAEGAPAAAPLKAAIDPRVVDAIEDLIRAGYLTKAHRDDIGANVPRDIKDRLARVVGRVPACPKPPWWSAFL